MIDNYTKRKRAALKLIKKYEMVEIPDWPGVYTFKDINANVVGYPLSLNLMGKVCFAAKCCLCNYNTISFDSWNTNVKIENFEKKLLKLKKEYEDCTLKRKQNILKKKFEEIAEDFV